MGGRGEEGFLRRGQLRILLFVPSVDEDQRLGRHFHTVPVTDDREGLVSCRVEGDGRRVGRQVDGEAIRLANGSQTGVVAEHAHERVRGLVDGGRALELQLAVDYLGGVEYDAGVVVAEHAVLPVVGEDNVAIARLRISGLGPIGRERVVDPRLDDDALDGHRLGSSQGDRPHVRVTGTGGELPGTAISGRVGEVHAQGGRHPFRFSRHFDRLRDRVGLDDGIGNDIGDGLDDGIGDRDDFGIGCTALGDGRLGAGAAGGEDREGRDDEANQGISCGVG